MTEELKLQEKILSGIIIDINKNKYKSPFFSFLNDNFFDIRFRDIVYSLVDFKFVNPENFKEVLSFDESINKEQVEYYVRQLIDLRKKERFKKFKDKIVKSENMENLSTLINDINSEESTNLLVNIEDLKVSNVLEKNIDFLFSFKGKEILGSPFGIKSLDNVTEGIFGLVGLTAVPGAGKSSLAFQSAFHNAFTLKKPVLYITLEISKEMFLSKLISFITGIPTKKLLKTYLNTIESRNVSSAFDMISHNENLFVMDSKDGVNFFNIEKKIREIKDITGQENILVILDYLNLFHDSGTTIKLDHNQKVANQMVRFIEIKNETKRNFILIASKNKQGYSTAELSSIKGPNDLEYAFETIISLEKPKNIEINHRGNTNTFRMIMKSRWGEARIPIPLFFDGRKSKFFDITELNEKN